MILPYGARIHGPLFTLLPFGLPVTESGGNCRLYWQMICPARTAEVIILIG
jgi:hypothetical protein